MSDLTTHDLQRLAIYASRRDPDCGDEAKHSYSATCPWCRPTSHDLGAALVAELARLRADRDAMLTWLVEGLCWPIDVAYGGHTFPESWRADLLAAWWRDDGYGEREEYVDFIAEEAGWSRAASGEGGRG